jgi:ketosteroid isomerase-like protein
MSGQDNINLVKQVYEDFGKGDIPSLLTRCTDNIEWIHPSLENLPITDTWRGQGEVGEFFKSLGETQEPQQFEPQEYMAQDDKVVVLGRYAWRAIATGDEFESDWVHVFRIRDGKLASFREYSDIRAAATGYQESDASVMGRGAEAGQTNTPRPGLH